MPGVLLWTRHTVPDEQNWVLYLCLKLYMQGRLHEVDQSSINLVEKTTTRCYKRHLGRSHPCATPAQRLRLPQHVCLHRQQEFNSHQSRALTSKINATCEFIGDLQDHHLCISLAFQYLVTSSHLLQIDAETNSHAWLAQQHTLL